jgi:hypothetical protein
MGIEHMYVVYDQPLRPRVPQGRDVDRALALRDLPAVEGHVSVERVDHVKCPLF